MPTRIIGLSGSLRIGSLNGRLVEAAGRLAAPGIDLTVFRRVADIPFFNEDREGAESRGPSAVSALRELVATADGLLISTPEYNQALPAVTKNLVDWLSRPDDDSVLDGRPVAILGATTGSWGTRLAQKDLRHTLTAAGALVMPQPMLFVARGDESFDAAGRLTDPRLEARLRELLTAFDEWIELVGRSTPLIAASA